ncbi:MAG: hypothetical protein KDB73_05275 [Planctomycetes bacterium]|nr:hypothetical protein [Planctomycetota bacterium]
MRKACLCLVVACGGLAGCAVPLEELEPLDGRARAAQVHASRSDSHDAHSMLGSLDLGDRKLTHRHDDRPLLRTDLRRGWFECFEHVHEGRCGTPMVHAFLTEPAFLGRDLIVGAELGEDEREVEAEIEWALSRRLGLVVEVPWIDAESTGFGDPALGLKALLVEEERALLSASIKVEVPMASTSSGLGSGSWAYGAGLHGWFDLGSWTTLQTYLGVEHLPAEDETELVWSLSLGKSLGWHPFLGDCGSAQHDHGPTSVTLMAEVAGVAPLGSSDDDLSGRWLLGASLPLSRSLDLRGGFTRTWGDTEREEAWVVEVIVHF